jgi:hypothetical protein
VRSCGCAAIQSRHMCGATGYRGNSQTPRSSRTQIRDAPPTAGHGFNSSCFEIGRVSRTRLHSYLRHGDDTLPAAPLSTFTCRPVVLRPRLTTGLPLLWRDRVKHSVRVPRNVSAVRHCICARERNTIACSIDARITVVVINASPSNEISRMAVCHWSHTLLHAPRECRARRFVCINVTRSTMRFRRDVIRRTSKSSRSGASMQQTPDVPCEK